MKFETLVIKENIPVFVIRFEADTDEEAFSKHSEYLNEYSKYDDSWDNAFISEISETGVYLRTPVLENYEIEAKLFYADSDKIDYKYLGTYKTYDEAFTDLKKYVLKELEDLNETTIEMEDIENDSFKFRADFDSYCDAIIRLWDGDDYRIVSIYNINKRG